MSGLLIFEFFLFDSVPRLLADADIQEGDAGGDAVLKSSGAELYNLFFKANDGLAQVYYDSFEGESIVGGRTILALPTVTDFQYIIQSSPLWSCQTLVNNGPSQNRIDIVVLGDGFTSSELNNYYSSVNGVINSFLTQSPFAYYENFFNVHRVDVISAQSGVDEPDLGIYRNTALDMSYNCGGISKLLCIDTVKAWNAASAAPAADQLLALANSARYGGAGYTNLATAAAANTSGTEIALHEFGHSFGSLADEYDSSSQTYTGPEPPQTNVSIFTASQQVVLPTKWFRWLDLPNVDTFEGAFNFKYLIYRPTSNSKMRSLGRPFEQVNDEQLIFKIYEKVSIIDSATAPSAEPLSPATYFYVTPVRPFLDTITIQWFVDGQPVPNIHPTSFIADACSLTNGTHTVSVTVKDNTSMVRDETKRAALMTKTLNWQINVARAVLSPETAVDFIDYASFAASWMNDCSSPSWCSGLDFDYSGRVDLNDLAILNENWLAIHNPADVVPDGSVSLDDFAAFAARWQQKNCAGPDWCSHTDLDKDGKVSEPDLIIFIQHWLDDDPL